MKVTPMDVVELARDLVRLNTVNPPGSESAAARLVANRLEVANLDSEIYELEQGRESLIARLPGSDPGAAALCLSGHLDTVGVGTREWSHDPLGGEIDGDRLWGRGSTDMKGGCAAMIAAFITLAGYPQRRRPVVLALSASEETGAQGAAQLAGHLGDVGALIVGEPTSGRVAVAHKGVAWLHLDAVGRAAHGSLPHLGVNAIVNMAEAVGALRSVDFSGHDHHYLGSPTINVGTIRGGNAPNIVPDHCEALVDVRLVPGLHASQVQAVVQRTLGPQIDVTIDTDLPAVETLPDHEWIQSVLEAAAEIEGHDAEPIGVRYFTDASILVPALGGVPVAIVGPGEAALAHQVDEWCSVSAVERARILYERACREWACI